MVGMSRKCCFPSRTSFDRYPYRHSFLYTDTPARYSCGPPAASKPRSRGGHNARTHLAYSFVDVAEMVHGFWLIWQHLVESFEDSQGLLKTTGRAFEKARQPAEDVGMCLVAPLTAAPQTESST